LIGQDFKPRRDLEIGRIGRERTGFLLEDGKTNAISGN